MRTFSMFLLLVVATAGGLAGGYRLGTGAWPDKKLLDRAVSLAVSGGTPSASEAMQRPRTVLYWKHPDGRPQWSATPAKTEDGRDFVAVHDDEEPNFPGTFESRTAAAASTGDGSGERKILYYRNPMGLADTSPEPKKDWMGMDYIAVYEGEEQDDGKTVKVSLDKVQRAGVRSAPAEFRSLARPVRAVGKVALDESQLRIVTLRFDGFIEKLYVNTTGASVRKGEPLFRVFSQDVLSALANYRVSMITAGKKSGREADGALRRLTNLEVPREHIRRIGPKGDIPDSLDWPSPVTGTIMEKMVIEGERAEAGRALFKIADLTHVWVVAEVPEQELGIVHEGAAATLTLRSMAGKTLAGTVTFVYPELDPATRTGRVRIALDNPDGLLKPEMFVDIVIDAGTGDAPRLVVPTDAVIDSGSRQVVILDRGEGRFEPRPVKLGRRGSDLVEIVEGIAAGDRVVVTANFLIDAESNLRTALKSLAPGGPSADKTPSAAGPASQDGAASTTAVGQ